MSIVASDTAYRSLLEFLGGLDGHRVSYSLTSVRPEAVMVQFALPGERWEVEFGDDGAVEVERFLSDGTIVGDEALADLWQRLGADAD